MLQYNIYNGGKSEGRFRPQQPKYSGNEPNSNSAAWK
jgi:hypothetical protein